MRISVGKLSLLFIVFFSEWIFNNSVLCETSLLGKVRQKFESEKSFSVEVVLEQNNAAGKIFFQSPDLEKIVFGNYKIVVIADTIWNFNSKLNRLVIQEKEDDFTPFSIYDILFKLPNECEYIENKGGNEFTLIPNNGDEINVRSVKVKMDKSFLPVFVKVTDMNNKIFSFSLKKYLFGIDFDRSFFEIKKLKGTKVVDLR